MKNKLNSISIIICFYNASSKLKETLKHILQMDLSDIEAELILVNNNSTDNSLQVISESMAENTSLAYKIVTEEKKGLANARMCGVNHAKHEVLLFCDDDNWLSECYAKNAITCLNNDEKIAVVGGKGIPISDIELPIWLNDHQGSFAIGAQWPETGEVKIKRNMVYGAGMTIRKSALDLLILNGFKFFSLGRTEKSLSSGEDSELCLAFRIAGFKIWYDEQLEFKHYIEPKRLTKDYLKALKKGISNSGYVSRFYRNYLFGVRVNVGKMFWLKELFYISKDIIKAIFMGQLSSIKGLMNHLKYLLKERESYDKDVKEVINICNKLNKLNTNSIY
jgi:glycosyltransferase involved in cell wall biosynthesis